MAGAAGLPTSGAIHGKHHLPAGVAALTEFVSSGRFLQGERPSDADGQPAFAGEGRDRFQISAIGLHQNARHPNPALGCRPYRSKIG